MSGISDVPLPRPEPVIDTIERTFRGIARCSCGHRPAFRLIVPHSQLSDFEPEEVERMTLRILRTEFSDSEEKRGPVSDIDTAVVDSPKAFDPKRPIREADIAVHCFCERRVGRAARRSDGRDPRDAPSHSFLNAIHRARTSKAIGAVEGGLLQSCHWTRPMVCQRIHAAYFVSVGPIRPRSLLSTCPVRKHLARSNRAGRSSSRRRHTSSRCQPASPQLARRRSMASRR